ncbi:MAG TPA: hypothetical protein VF407_19335 [Polyangiaceae bacterium]
MRRYAFVVFSAAVSLLACAHAAPGQEPASELNSPRCVTDIECGRDQRCIKEENRPDGICAPKGAMIATTEPSAPPPKACKHDKDCGKPTCGKKMKGSTCSFCDADEHVCRTMHASP